MLNQIFITVKGQVGVKTLIVISMTSFDLSVMPWYPGPNQFVHNPLFLTVKIERMDPISFLKMS